MRPEVTFMAAIVGLIWLVLLMQHPRLLTGLTIFLTIVQLNWFTRYFGAPAVFNRATLVIIGFLGLRLALDFFTIKHRNLGNKKILNLVLLLAAFFLVLTLFSNTYNQESLLLGVYELRYFFAGFVLCFSLYFYFHEVLNIILFKEALIWLALGQLPFAIIQYLAAGGGDARTLDSVAGSFSGYGELVSCQVLAIGIVLHDKLIYKKNGLSINGYFLVVLLIMPLLLSKSRTATAFVIMVVAFTWLVSVVRRKNFVVTIRLFGAVSIIGALFLALFYYFFWLPNYDLKQQINIDYAYNYYMRTPEVDRHRLRPGEYLSVGRFRAVVEAVRLIWKHPINIVVGYGSGASSEASFIKKTGKYFQWYGPLAGLGGNHYSKTIAEYGMAGLGGFVLFFLTVYRRLKDVPQTNPDIRSIFGVILFCLAIISVYTTTLGAFFFSFVVAFYLAVAQAELDQIQDVNM